MDDIDRTVKRFAEAMEKKLREKEPEKTHWTNEEIDWHLEKLLKEYTELEDAYEHLEHTDWKTYDERQSQVESVKQEAVDVANFAMFIFDMV